MIETDADWLRSLDDNCGLPYGFGNPDEVARRFSEIADTLDRLSQLEHENAELREQLADLQYEKREAANGSR
jgi:hypothetical protein